MGNYKSFEQKLADFHFVHALSKPDDNDDWDGRTGLITDVVKESEGAMAEKEAYLCGSPGMIDACVKVLTEGADPATMPVESQKTPKLVINTTAAERMGVTIPQSLLDKADETVK